MRGTARLAAGLASVAVSVAPFPAAVLTGRTRRPIRIILLLRTVLRTLFAGGTLGAFALFPLLSVRTVLVLSVRGALPCRFLRLRRRFFASVADLVRIAGSGLVLPSVLTLPRAAAHFVFIEVND